MSDFLLRRAMASDADALTALAHASKRYWGYDEAWIRLWRDDLTFTPGQIASQDVYLIETTAGIDGVYALSIAADQAELEALWVQPEAMGQGVGRALFSHAVKMARARRVQRIIIVSDPYAEGFYLRMGAVRIGEEPSLPQGRQLPKLVYELNAAEINKMDS